MNQPKTRKPRICLTMRLESPTRRFYLGRDYSEALASQGGVPWHLSLIPDEEYIATVLDNADGILLPGSDTDVEPRRFGQEPHPRLGTVQPLKDETDALVLSVARRKRLPVLAICYGMQALNVACGGTLIQDIEAQRPDAIQHQQGAPRERRSHRVQIKSGSLLATLAGANHAWVNSHHHQAVAEVGTGLHATAWTADGLVEALEGADPEHFILGVQWHPEIAWAGDTFAQAIFARFIAASGEAML